MPCGFCQAPIYAAKRCSCGPGTVTLPTEQLYAKLLFYNTVVLAGARPVRVSAGAPGSRPQPKAEMPPATAGRRKPLKETGARKRAAISSERCSHVIFSAERCLKGPSRSYHGEGNRQQPRPERLLDLSGVWGGG